MTTAIVVGGGTGGLAVAVALRRVGFDVVALERAATMDETHVGGGHVLWHNAVLALRRLGVGDAVESVAPVLERYEFRNRRGRLLATWPVADRGRHLGVPAVTITRASLHRALAEAAGDVVRTGARVVGFRQDATGAAAELADGEVVRGDILVGADGLKSVVRSQLLGDGPPRYAGYTAWQGLVRFPAASLDRGLFTNTSGRGLRFFSFRVDKEDTVYWDGVTGDREGGKALTAGSRRSTLLQRFDGWHPPIRALIDATDEAAISAIDVFDRPPVTRWGEGRVTLVGDAAHPATFNLGQGAAQAIEDAVVLGREVQRSSDVVAALRAYETSRHRRTAALTTMARRIGQVEQLRNPVVATLRDAFVSVAHERFVLKQTYKLMMDHDLDS